MDKINNIVSKMTLDEKAGLCSGLDMWCTKPVERLDVPSIMMTDGPHGLRKQKAQGDNLGIFNSVPATAFPTASLTACSFDRSLLTELGEALGEECLAEDVAIILGPGTNIKRSPLCGRNFEYFSEDPYLSSEMAKSHIKGVQSKGVGTSLKHFAANNQENRRMTSNSVVDERTLREIYLAAFETVVKETRPWTVMCSYNRVNGVYASENGYLLTDILRDEWGFEGIVVSDWGAVSDRVKGVIAGLDLEMPHSGKENDEAIANAVRTGKLSEDVLNQTVERLLKIILTADENRIENYKCDLDAHNELVVKIAAESMVLLKNENILPLNESQKITFVGEFFENPRYQGGGSSHVNSYKITSAQKALDGNENITYKKGFSIISDEIDAQLQSEAIESARLSDVCVIFAGLPESYESEGYDRKHMRLPHNQNDLIDKILSVQPNTVIVLHNGSPVEMPWATKAAAILEAYLAGQASGQAVAETLFGKRNPCGKLAETFPLKLSDNPAHLVYSLNKDTSVYNEGIFVGYRYYDKKEMPVLFPFGHGLSYTTFAYSNFSVDKSQMLDTDTLNISVKVKNSGTRAGKEIIQLYISPPLNDTINPVRQLRGFEKVHLLPEEEKTVTFSLNFRDFAYYNIDIEDWYVDGGEYTICIGKSSRDIVCSETVSILPQKPIQQFFTVNSTLKEILEAPSGLGNTVIDELASKIPLLATMKKSSENSEGAAFAEIINAMPLRSITTFGGGAVSMKELEELIWKCNIAHRKINAVIFDLDGVIVSTDHYHFDAWKVMADKEGIPFTYEDNHRLRGISRMESLNIILEKAAKVYSEDEKLELATFKNEKYKELLTLLTPFDILPGVMELIHALKEQGYKIAIGSSSKNAMFILKKIGLLDYFDAVADGNHIKKSKPDPEIFLVAAEFLGIPPDNCAVIEDATSGIKAAVAANMLPIAVGEAMKAEEAEIKFKDLKKYRKLLYLLTLNHSIVTKLE